MSLLRKQQSRLFCACYGVPAGQGETLGDTFWIPAFAGMTPLGQLRLAGLSHQGRGGLLHSANVTRF